MTITAIARDAMNAYVRRQFEDDPDLDWPLGRAWLEALTDSERAHIAAAIIDRNEALCDPPFRVLSTYAPRGRYADRDLCIVADQMHLA